MKKILASFICLLFLSSTFLQVESSTLVTLTPEESDFIAEHPVIKLGVDPNFIPYEFIDIDNTYNGIAKDYLDLISQKTGLKFEITKGLTWDEAYEKVILKELDGLPIIGKSSEREKYLLFSNSYYSFQRVLFINRSETNIDSINDLEGRVVAVQKNSSHHEYLKTIDNITISLYDTVEEALVALSNNKEIAFVGNLATTLYIAKNEGISQLEYMSIPNQTQQTLHFAVRNDYPVLIDIINKGLKAITTSEKIEIDNRWIGVVSKTDYTLLIQVVSILGLMAASIVLASGYWIIRLQKEIKHRKETELELQYAKEEADRANQVKSSFLARMSHEIRTPLNAISGMSYILKKSGLTMTQQNYLDKISFASKDVLEIINDILDFAKIESGKVELELVPFNLDEILEHIISIVSFKADEQGVDLQIDRDPKIPMYFYGDSKRLQQILLNLLNNSVKFTDKGSVTLKIEEIEKKDKIHSLKVSIIDTGIGMTEEQISNLFKPFMQADSSINRRFGGTGLGLSIVKSLLDLMNGKIEVTSVQNEGSIFNIYIELEEDEDRNIEQKRLASELYLGEIKTLILDKSLVHAKMIQDYLNAFNLSSEIYTDEKSAEEAIYKAFSINKPYDLFILDYETPKDKGFEFCRKLKQRKWVDQTLKTILLFPFNLGEVINQIDQEGIQLGLNKPVIPSVLFNGIVDLFRNDVYQKIKPDQNKGLGEMKYNFNILLFEDNKTNQFIAQSILEQSGYTVKIVENGLIGLDEFKQNLKIYDIILMDLHMPVMNGFEATIELRKLDKNIPIIAMSADAISGIDEQCREVGINNFITKPFDPATLALKVYEFIGKENPSITINHHEEIVLQKVILDESKGLVNVGGNKELYHRILGLFLEECKDVNNHIDIALQQEDYEHAKQIVHKLKGSSGTIGATPLYETAILYQKALSDRDLDLIQEYHPIFIEQVDELIDFIRNKYN